MVVLFLIEWIFCVGDILDCKGLVGFKVFDLICVLVGLVVMCFFVGFGVDVLWIDLLYWNELVVEVDVMLGKCCVGLDLC